MSRTWLPVERRKLNAVAREYREKGYRVTKEPRGDALPDFLAGLEPALVALHTRENVAVVIETTDSLSESHDLVPLAQAIDPRPDWRLELHVVRAPADQESALLDWWQIKHRLADARELLDDQEEAALLLASASAEAATRLIAKRNDVRLTKIERETPFASLTYLYSIGLVDADDYNAIYAASRPYIRMVQGNQAKTPIREITARMIEAVEHLLSEIPAQIAS